MGLKVFTTPSIPLTGDRNPSRKGKDVTALQGFFLKSSRPSLLIKRAALGNFESELSLYSLASLFPIKEGIFLPLRLSCKERLFSKTYPSFLTLKEGSTSHLGLLSSGEKKETALLGAQNRYAIRLADHQRSSPGCAGWDRLETKYL